MYAMYGSHTHAHTPNQTEVYIDWCTWDKLCFCLQIPVSIMLCKTASYICTKNVA